MTYLIVQIAICLLIAFLLGLLIGWWLKSVSCGRRLRELQAGFEKAAADRERTFLAFVADQHQQVEAQFDALGAAWQQRMNQQANSAAAMASELERDFEMKLAALGHAWTVRSGQQKCVTADLLADLQNELQGRSDALTEASRLQTEQTVRELNERFTRVIGELEQILEQRLVEIGKASETRLIQLEQAHQLKSEGQKPSYWSDRAQQEKELEFQKKVSAREKAALVLLGEADRTLQQRMAEIAEACQIRLDQQRQVFALALAEHNQENQARLEAVAAAAMHRTSSGGVSGRAAMEPQPQAQLQTKPTAAKTPSPKAPSAPTTQPEPAETAQKIGWFKRTWGKVKSLEKKLKM